MQESALRRNLSFRDLVVFGLLFIGPLAPVGVFGVLDAQAGGAVALVYVVATLAMSCTAWSYAQMSRQVPHAGSVFAYAREGLAPTAGFIAGWMIMLDYLLIPAVAYLFSGIALHALVPSVPAWVFTIVAFASTTLLNLMGMRHAARVGRVALAAEVAVLVVFVVSAVVVLARNGAARPWISPITGVVGGGAVSLVARRCDLDRRPLLPRLRCNRVIRRGERGRRAAGGAGDHRLPDDRRRLLHRAELSRRVAERDVAAQLAANPEAQGTAFYDVTRAAIGGWLATVLAVTKAIGPAFAAMTGQGAAARLLYGMARDGGLPASLGEGGLHARRAAHRTRDGGGAHAHVCRVGGAAR